MKEDCVCTVKICEERIALKSTAGAARRVSFFFFFRFKTERKRTR